MLANIFLSRVSLPIVLVGSFAIIFAIKITPLLLPAQYYFNFSTLITGGSGDPFLVSPPGVTAKKLCELLDKHAIPRDIFGREITCREDLDLLAQRGTQRPTFNVEQLDKIYDLAFTFDRELRNSLRAAQPIPIKILTNEQIDEILTRQSTPRAAFSNMLLHYTGELSNLVHFPLTNALTSRYGLKDPVPPADEAPPPPAGTIAPDQRAQIVAAHEAFVKKFSVTQVLASAPPIRKSTVDHAVALSWGHADVPSRLATYYSDAVGGAMRTELRAAFAASGIQVADENEEKQFILREIARFSYLDYMISILVRLAPVLLFGLVVGAVSGRGEATSAAVAAALAALLLCWPLVLMWERLVEHAWANRRELFLVFYAVYIASFFVTARAGAVVGAGLRQRFGLPADRADPAVSEAIAITWRDVALNIVGAVVLNTGLYAWNAVIPLSSAGSN